MGRGDNNNCSKADTETKVIIVKDSPFTEGTGMSGHGSGKAGTGDELTNIAETDHPGIEEPIQEEEVSI